MIDLCCLTELQVMNVIENIYSICDCCQEDLYDDTLFDNIDLDNIEDLYE